MLSNKTTHYFLEVHIFKLVSFIQQKAHYIKSYQQHPKPAAILLLLCLSALFLPFFLLAPNRLGSGGF